MPSRWSSATTAGSGGAPSSCRCAACAEGRPAPCQRGASLDILQSGRRRLLRGVAVNCKGDGCVCRCLLELVGVAGAGRCAAGATAGGGCGARKRPQAASPLKHVAAVRHHRCWRTSPTYPETAEAPPTPSLHPPSASAGHHHRGGQHRGSRRRGDSRCRALHSGCGQPRAGDPPPAAAGRRRRGGRERRSGGGGAGRGKVGARRVHMGQPPFMKFRSIHELRTALCLTVLLILLLCYN